MSFVVVPVSSVLTARITICVKVSPTSGFTPFSLTFPVSVFIRSPCKLLRGMPRSLGYYWRWLLLILVFEDVAVSSLVLLLISPRVVITVGRSLIFAGILVVIRATWPAHFCFVVW